MRKPSQQQLCNELQALVRHAEFEISSEVCEQAVEYLYELARWNKVHNLTALSDLREMLKVHLLDSWSVLPYLPQGSILDLGTGAGLPGIPLALAAPDRTYVLLDSRRKKTDFLEHIVQRLQLKNVQIICARAEQYQPERLFDGVVSRAVGSVKQIIEISHGLCSPTTEMLLMKGKFTQAELQEIPIDYTVQQYRLLIRGWDVERTLICLQQTKIKKVN